MTNKINNTHYVIGEVRKGKDYFLVEFDDYVGEFSISEMFDNAIVFNQTEKEKVNKIAEMFGLEVWEGQYK